MNYFARAFWCLLAGVAAFSAVTILDGQTPPAARGNKTSSPGISRFTEPLGAQSARELIGEPVESQAGERIAKVNDLLIDPQTGRIIFIVLASGGFVGVGVKLRPVPPAMISPSAAKRRTLMMDVTHKEWKAAPRMEKERLAKLENTAEAQRIYTYYHQPWLAPTGKVSPSRKEPLKLASGLIGESVVNRREGEVGRISDVAINLRDFAPARALVVPIGFDRKMMFVPINRFEADAIDGRLVLNAQH